MNFLKIKSSRRLGALAFVLAAVLAGCSSPGESFGGSTVFASVEIRGHSTDEILHTTASVFRDNGYTLRSAHLTELVFERDGTMSDRMAYGDWGDGVLLRVKTQINPLTEDSYRLQCQAWMVRRAGDRIFEDEQKLAHFRNGPFQKLMDQTARQLE